MRISSQEKKLLLFAGFIILAIVFYFYVFEPIRADLNAAKAENELLQQELAEAQLKVSEEVAYDKIISENTTSIKSFLKLFYTKNLQEFFIRKMEGMYLSSEVYFKATDYLQIDEVLSDGGGGAGNDIVDAKSYLNEEAAKVDTESKESGAEKSAEEKAAEESAQNELDAGFVEFMDSLKVTSTEFRFGGTYFQIWSFIKLMEENMADESKYVIANTFEVKEQSDYAGSDSGLPGYYNYKGFDKDSDQTYDATIIIYYYMTNPEIDYVK